MTWKSNKPDLCLRHDRLPDGCPRPGQVWRHYKGDEYEVVLISVREHDGAVLVSYISDAGRVAGLVPWTRELDVFVQAVPEADLVAAGVPHTPGVPVPRYRPITAIGAAPTGATLAGDTPAASS